MVKKLPAKQETRVWSLGQEDSLEKGMVSHSSILAWRIPWTIQSMGSQKVRHDRRDLACTHTCGLERFQVSSPVELGFKLHNMPTAAAAKLLQSCSTV